MSIATFDVHDSTRKDTSSSNPQSVLPSKEHLTEVQAAYSVSCTYYEEKASKKLAHCDTFVVSGYGCSLSVKNNALRVYPGKTHKDQKQETVMLYRGVHGIKQIILMSRKGEVTLDALNWCHEQLVALTLLDNRGNLIQSLGYACLHDALLRRRQYKALENGMAGKISCELVKRKVAGQLETLRLHPELKEREYTIKLIENEYKPFTRRILPSHLYDVNTLRQIEERIANVYFQSWYDLPLSWEKQALKTIPPHWQFITERTSPLSKNHGARWATNPFHAMLNYAYALLESQCKQALNLQGFDVACGFLHSDQLYRDSLVYDLMEVHRAKIDHLVLKLIQETTFRKGDVMTTKDGTVQFNPQLARYLVARCQLSQKDIDASALWFKSLLL